MQKPNFVLLARRVGIRYVFYAMDRESARVLSTGYWLDELRDSIAEHIRLSPGERATVERAKPPIWLVASQLDGWFEVTEEGLQAEPFDFSALVPEKREGHRILRITRPRVLFVVVDGVSNRSLGIYESETDAKEHRLTGCGGPNNLLATLLGEIPEETSLHGVFSDNALDGVVVIVAQPEPPTNTTKSGPKL